MTLETEILNEKFEIKPKSIQDFSNILEESITSFENDNYFIKGIRDDSIKIKNYHDLLRTLFAQVQSSSSTFALAGSMLDERALAAKEYLYKHAEEEKTHWTWIISDLRSTGFNGQDPRQEYPTIEAQSYLSYATYLALKFPIGRLAMAAVLEGISGRFGEKYGLKVAKSLTLNQSQMRFFLSHGELDKGHSQEVVDVIHGVNPTPTDISKMCHVATCTTALYKAMYNCAMLKGF